MLKCREKDGIVGDKTGSQSGIKPRAKILGQLSNIPIIVLVMKIVLQTCTQWLSEFNFFTAANIIQPRLTQHWIKYRTYIEKPTRVPEHSTMT